MSKWFIALFFSIITSNALWAQDGNLEIKGTGTDLYLEHTVVPKESFFSVGRLYNIAPKEIAAYNHLQLAAGLKVGEALKIPMNKNNFTQTGALARGEALVPVYHNVEAGETLYRLGVNYDKVALTSLKKWNRLSSDEVSVGQPMIIGYLKVNKSQSVLANRKAAPVVEATAVVPQKEEKTVVKKPEVVAVAEPAVKNAEAVKAASNGAANVKTDESKVPVPQVKTRRSIYFSGGYFKNLYNQQTANKVQTDNNGVGGVFKSTSGWQDGKYYCFSNDAAPGSVLKITDNATGKNIYVKVLDAIPDIKQNSGLSIVISNAASDELGVGENKFDCIVSFAK
ncbi:MAG: LysM peptidoglycan-binding domain-containing protein [Ginsengibacter sp.]